MSETKGFDIRIKGGLIAGAVVVLALVVATFTWGGDEADARTARSAAQLVELPETDAPLADVAETLTPEPAEDPAPRAADVTTLASIPSVPKLTAAMADAVEPIMFVESLEQPEAEENPAVSYATVSDFLVASSPNPQPLRPIDDRPVHVLATIGGSGSGMGIGADGPHCKPQRGPGLRFTRSPVVSGVTARMVPRM
jgi:hypothetical protein